jgi:hypothetical protein
MVDIFLNCIAKDELSGLCLNCGSLQIRWGGVTKTGVRFDTKIKATVYCR